MRPALKNRYPILRSILIWQVVTITLTISIVYLDYIAIRRAQKAAAVEVFRRQIEPILAAHQEQLRAWKFLGMDAAVQSETRRLAAQLSLDTLELSEIHEAQLAAQAGGIVLPTPSKEPDGKFYVIATFDPDRVIAAPAPIRIGTTILFAFAVLLCSVTFVSAFVIRRRIYAPLRDLTRAIDELRTKGTLNTQTIHAEGEMREFLETIENMHFQVRDLEKTAATVETARQVVHDIRSPLAVLDSLLGASMSVPAENRMLMQKALERIHSITQGLLDRTRQECTGSASIPRIGTSANGKDTLAQVHVGLFLHSVVQQANAEHLRAAHPAVAPSFGLDRTALDAFGAIASESFHRAVSNVLNNAVEAVEGRGHVKVEVAATSDIVRISIEDDGKGIPAEILPKVLERDFTYGKPSGNGLGLWYASNVFRALDGTIDIQSKEGLGTKVFITLPRTATPSWFCARIIVRMGVSISAVDDDPAMLALWKRKLQLDTGNPRHLAYQAFTSLAEFEAAVIDGPPRPRESLFLIDYDFRGSERNGVQAIRSLGISNQAILVTGRWDDPDTLEECAAIGCKVLPKALIPWLEIQYE